MSQSHLPRMLEATSVLLFFLQAIRVLFSVLFGIIYDQVFAGPVTYGLFLSLLLVIVAVLAPAFAPRSPGRYWLAVFSILAGLGRIALSINDASYRFWGSLVVLAAAGLYLVSLITVAKPIALPALVAALVLDQVFRLLGDTYDITLRPGWFWVQVAWSALLVILSARLVWQTAHFRRSYGAPGSFWGLAVGSFFFLETSLLSLPNAVARWSGGPYALVALGLLAITLLPLSVTFRRVTLASLCQSRLAQAILVAILVGGLLVGYFTDGVLATLFLLIAQAVAMVAITCLMAGPPARLQFPGPKLALGLLFLLLLNFFNAFAFTYPYVLPAMRGLGWAVYLVAALVLGSNFIRQRLTTRDTEELVIQPSRLLIVGALVLGIGLFSVRPRSISPPQEPGIRHVASYNIHYGYDAAWHYTLSEIAEAMLQEGVDIAVLQEVDAGRLTSYGVDNAYFLSRRLGMHVIYLPTVEHLTGIAILSRDEPVLSDTRLLTSLQEQTGVIHALLEPEGRTLHVYGIWMGLSDEDTMTQIGEALDFIGPSSPAVFGGDFNAEPESPVVAAVLQAGFADPFESLGIDPPPPTAPAIDPRDRIDYVWLRGLDPVHAWVSDSLASDHRMVVVEVETAP